MHHCTFLFAVNAGHILSLPCRVRFPGRLLEGFCCFLSGSIDQSIQALTEIRKESPAFGCKAAALQVCDVLLLSLGFGPGTVELRI